MDILGPLPITRTGNRYVLVMADYFSKWPEAIAVPNQEAETIARVFIRELVCRFGAPLELHTDQGRNFEAVLMAEVLRILQVRKTRTTALHPQSDGMVERLNRTLLRYLASFVDRDQRDWDDWVSLFLLSYRSEVHETTGYSPAVMLMAWDLRLPTDLEKGIPPTTEAPQTDFAVSLQEKLDEIHGFTRDKIKLASDRMKAGYDLRSRDIRFDTRDLLWLFQPRRLKGRCPKLQSD